MDLWIVDALFQTENTITLKSRARNLRTLCTSLYLIHSSAPYALLCIPLDPLHHSALLWTLCIPLPLNSIQSLYCIILVMKCSLLQSGPFWILCTQPHPMHPSALICILKDDWLLHSPYVPLCIPMHPMQGFMLKGLRWLNPGFAK